MSVVVVLIASFLLGSIPFATLVSSRLRGQDITAVGTGNPGTMNVLDVFGFRLALIVAIGDVGKGAAAVGLAYLAGLGDAVAALAAILAVLGHDYSVFLRLRGGNGTATTVGGLFALVPIAAAVGVGTAIVLSLLTGTRRIPGVLGFVLVIALVYAIHGAEAKLVGASALLVITGLKHLPVRRLSERLAKPHPLP